MDDTHSAIESAALADATKRHHFTFGAGRRICQGMHIAERSLFIAMARILWAFTIKKAKLADGSDIEIPRDSFTDAIVLTLEPFEIGIEARGAGKVDIIRSEAKTAKGAFAQMNLPV